MSRDGSVDLEFAGETRRFRLAYGELVRLQERVDAGPFWLIDQLRLRGREIRLQHIRHILILGLVGGGMKEPDAVRLVEAETVAKPDWLEWVVVATLVLTEAVTGAAEDPPGKPEAEAES